MSDGPKTSYGTFTWGCGHEGNAACATCYDDRVAEVERLRNELRFGSWVQGDETIGSLESEVERLRSACRLVVEESEPTFPSGTAYICSKASVDQCREVLGDE